MAQEKKVRRLDLDLDAAAITALGEGRAMPHGANRGKRAGILRNAADVRGPVFAKRGRRPKKLGLQGGAISIQRLRSTWTTR
jgi:hypothetical protein